MTLLLNLTYESVYQSFGFYGINIGRVHAVNDEGRFEDFYFNEDTHRSIHVCLKDEILYTRERTTSIKDATRKNIRVWGRLGF